MVVFLSADASQGPPSPVDQLYDHLSTLSDIHGGGLYLSEVDGGLNWPERGIYVFFDRQTDLLRDPVENWHIVRIGTVGDCAGSSSTLWERLRTHRGTTRGDYAGGGNCRGSIWRKHLGRAIIEREGLHDDYPHWGVPHRNLSADIETTELREQEHPLEQRVSEYIRELPFLVIDVPGGPGPDCARAQLEKNLIAMVAHTRRTTPRIRRDEWLGRHSPKPEIAKTGLWNIDHVSGFYSQDTIDTLARYIEKTDPVG